MEKSLRAIMIVVLLALFASTHGVAAGNGPTVSDLQAAQGRMEAQLQALADRLNQLEVDNAALKGEVEQLNAALGRREAEVETLKAQSQQAGEVAAQAVKDADKLKGAEWTSRIKFKGDLRIRSDRLESESLEEEFVDRLLESTDLVRGFTSYPISGHGGRMATASVSERVRGRSDRVLFQIGMGRGDVGVLLAHLRSVMPNPEVAWWVLPVEGFGRLL